MFMPTAFKKRVVVNWKPTQRATKGTAMAKISDYTTNFATADDFREGEKELTISNVIEERVGKGDGAEMKLVLYAQELEGMGVVLNKSNLYSLAKIFGSEETDDWQGEKVIAWRDPTVQFGGKKVGGIAFKSMEANRKKAV